MYNGRIWVRANISKRFAWWNPGVPIRFPSSPDAIERLLMYRGDLIRPPAGFVSGESNRKFESVGFERGGSFEAEKGDFCPNSDFSALSAMPSLEQKLVKMESARSASSAGIIEPKSSKKQRMGMPKSCATSSDRVRGETL